MRATIYKIGLILRKAAEVQNIYDWENEKKLRSLAYLPQVFTLLMRGGFFVKRFSRK